MCYSKNITMNEQKESTMELVKDVFTLHEFTFTKLKRNGRVAIYEQTLTRTGRRIAYEVVVIRESPERKSIIGGKEITFKHKEVYPTDTQWGKLGWSYVKMEYAEEQFNKLLKEISEGKKF